jgi:hypothetical protein
LCDSDLKRPKSKGKISLSDCVNCNA